MDAMGNAELWEGAATAGDGHGTRRSPVAVQAGQSGKCVSKYVTALIGFPLTANCQLLNADIGTSRQHFRSCQKILVCRRGRGAVLGRKICAYAFREQHHSSEC